MSSALYSFIVPLAIIAILAVVILVILVTSVVVFSGSISNTYLFFLLRCIWTASFLMQKRFVQI